MKNDTADQTDWSKISGQSKECDMSGQSSVQTERRRRLPKRKLRHLPKREASSLWLDCTSGEEATPAGIPHHLISSGSQLTTEQLPRQKNKQGKKWSAKRLKLKQRSEKKHKEKPSQCDHCQKMFTSNPMLMRHMKTHEKVAKPHPCMECSKSFTLPKQLAKHMRIHSGVTCEICGRWFKTHHYIKQHMWSHTGEMPYKCTKCGKQYPTKFLMINHVRGTHTGERPHMCDVCGKSFISSNQMQRHMQVKSLLLLVCLSSCTCTDYWVAYPLGEL